MPEHPLKFFIDNDPDVMALVKQAESLEFSDGALSKKTKLLIALGIDTTLGAVGGIRALSEQALAAGATEAEILETLRVAHFIGGQSKLYPAARALDGLIFP
jgi:alkylhydroperoxidase/carboxymuconolactone decarboxylase family protein YurZ